MKKAKAMPVFLLVVCLACVASAQPVIKGFSNSKTGDNKTMFLVKAGEKITFSVQAEGAKSYEWTVNKAPAGGKKAKFTWTVPNEKGIWEIHVKASGKGGLVHQEWVVSTLTKDEAPTFFDYFTDKRYAKREAKDPWGRALPEWGTQAIAVKWTEWQEMWLFLPGGKWGVGYGEFAKKLSVLNASCCFVQAPSETPKPDYPLHLLTRLIGPRNGMEFGTWKFRFRFPNGRTKMKSGKTHLKVYFANNQGYLWYPFWYGVACDGFQGFRVGADKFDNDKKFPVDKKWHEVTLIRTKENKLYCYIDGVFKFRGASARQLHKPAVCMEVGLARFQPDRYPKDTVYFDNVEIYEEKYLFPCKRVAIAGGKCKNIVVGGCDVGLKEIAETVKDPSIFSYDPAKKQAVCKAVLLVEGGADLVLSGETLKVESYDNSNMGTFLFVKPNATLRADKSTIAGRVGFKRPFDVCLTDTSLPIIDGKFQLPALAMGKWRFDKVTFSGPKTVFILEGDTTRLNVYNSNFAGNVSAVGKGKTPGTLGLVNCKFGDLKASKGAGIAPKYFLDIRAIDRRGKPIPNARVTIVNEVDDFNFPAENCKEFQPHGGGTSAYMNESVLPRKISYTTLRRATTGKEGHTPGPADAKKTIVLTDFVRNGGKNKEFTYTITVEIGSGRRAIRQVITGVNPGPEWYRADPDKPAYTITAKLDGKVKTVTEEELKKAGLAGPVKVVEKETKKGKK